MVKSLYSNEMEDAKKMNISIVGGRDLLELENSPNIRRAQMSRKNGKCLL